MREISQSGLYPSNCRLLDALEAGTTGAGTGEKNLMVLGFESAAPAVGEPMRLALDIAQSHGGVPNWRAAGRGRANAAPAGDGGESAVESWRGAFLLAPYLRDTFVACGVLSETFETAITWDRFEEFHAEAMAAVRAKVAEVCDAPTEGAGAPRGQLPLHPRLPRRPGSLLHRDRPGGPRRRGRAVGRDQGRGREAVIEGGGTITHHHAVGRDHRPWYDRQRPAPFAAALRAAKAELDPAGMLNPGVLIDPLRRGAARPA